MPLILTFTCVPIGIRGDKAYLDVLMIPQCDQNQQIKDLLGWGDLIKQLGGQFTAAGGKQLSLIAVDSIKSKLWTDLFADARVGTQPVTAAPIAPDGSSLNTVNALVSDFHSQAYGTKIAPRKQNQAPDVPTLQRFHSYAIEKHGLHTPDIGQGIQNTGSIVSNLKQLGDDEYFFGQNLTSARFRAYAPGGGAQGVFVQTTQGADGRLVRPPDAALHALGRLQVHYANSLRAAMSNSQILKVYPDTEHLAIHASRLMRAPIARTTVAAKQVAQQISSPPPSFNQRITMLLNAPAVLQALALVLRFELAVRDVTSLPTGGMHPMISLDASCNAIRKISKTYVRPQLRATYCTDNGFLPRPSQSPNVPQPITAQGWMVRDGYFAGSLQMESATMHIVGFANQAGLRQVSATPGNATMLANPPVTLCHDEDVHYPILPPSPRSGGFQVWRDGLQNAIYNQRQNAPIGPLFAEDLQNGVVVDVLPCDQVQKDACEKNGNDVSSWIRLCLREKETYRIHDIEVESHNVERGVRLSATRSLAPGASQDLAHDVDETIFNWRYGSLVNKPGLKCPNPPKNRSLSSLPRNLPWSDVPAPEVETPPDRSPLFGASYRTSMRAAFVTGSVVPFDPAIALASSLNWSPFTRYELMQGPELIPVNTTEHRMSQQSATTLFVGSRIQKSDGKFQAYSKVSQCVIVPPRVSSEVARRHGKSEETIEKGAQTIPLTLKGDLPDHLPYTGGGPDSDAPSYLPDPSVTGVWALLTDLAGNVISKCDLEFYASPSDWPSYVAHTLELHATQSTDASLRTTDPQYSEGMNTILIKNKSKTIKCEIPVGETFLLILRPKLAPAVWTEHSLAGLPQIDTTGTAEEQLYELALSDICRPTIVRLIHATDLPKLQPVIDPSTVTVNDTSVSINVTIDPRSTSKVALMAEWTEARDDLKKPIFEQLSVRAQLAAVDVKKAGSASIPVTGQFPFADSGHRHLRLTAVGTARYGSVFPREDNKTHTWESAQVETDRLATKPPHIPDVEYVLPNLYWEFGDGGRRRKRRMGLTVVLNRSWFTSGAGEQLAVITGTADQGEGMISTCFDAANREDKVSAWGLYSDCGSESGSGLCGQLQISKEAPPSTPSEFVPYSPNLQETATVTIGSTRYRALLYTPRYNQQDQQWYVNLSLSAPPAYGAMVRLLLIRYQGYAKSGKLTSDPTMCDFALLRPERAVTVTRTGWFLWKRIRVQIYGIRGMISNTYPKTRFEVRHFPFRLGQPIEFRWEEGRLISPEHHTPANVLWQGTINHPSPGERIVIQEWEIWPDAENAVSGERELPVYSDVLDI